MEDVPEDQVSLLSANSVRPMPSTIDRIVNRVRALTLKLLPLEVAESVITDPTSRVLTPAVVDAYTKAAGDFQETLPYCLLRARRMFLYDASRNPADFGENRGRAIACEMLARRIVHNLSPDRLNDVMAARFRHLEHDGDPSTISSALELAVDGHCTIFLSSTESQTVVNSLWRGDWLQRNNANQDIDYVAYNELRKHEKVPFLDPSRLAVPRYQNMFRMVIWIFFLFVYSQSVQQPLESQMTLRFDFWEILLYFMALAYTIEDFYKLATILWYFSWRAFGFWSVVSVFTDGLLITSFILRVLSVTLTNVDAQAHYKLLSFQVLSCVSPLIWMKIITVLDGFKYIGTMQICVSRMFQESTIFVLLLVVFGVGFAQALYALDASDGKTDHGSAVIHQLIQALLQSPDFESAGDSGLGLILYYLWSATVTVILLNILISLFSSAYDDVTTDAEAEFLSFFAEKTIGMIRAPDDYVFPAPFNLIEVIMVVCFEYTLSKENYAKLSKGVMQVTFAPVLLFIRIFERYIDVESNGYLASFFPSKIEGEEDMPDHQDPETSERENGMEIAKVKFEELIRAFPDPQASAEISILREVRSLNKKIDELLSQHSNGSSVSVKKEE